MKTIKINKNTNKTIPATVINYDEIIVSGGGLCMIANKNEVLEVYPGAKLHFEKHASGDSGVMKSVCERDVVVTDVVEAENGKQLIYFEYINIAPLTIASFVEVKDPAPYFKLYFYQEHQMVPLSSSTEQPEYVYTDFDTYFSSEHKKYAVYVVRGGNKIYFSDIELCYPSGFERGRNIFSDDGYCCPAEDTMFNYDTMDKNSVLALTSGITEGEEFKPQPGDQVIFCTNPYYFSMDSGKVRMFDGVTVSKYTNFMGLGVVLEEDYDAKRMFQEYQVNELFVNKIKKSIIPDFIDLEKVKYAPATSSSTEVLLATGLTFNLHFRTRVKDSTDPHKFKNVWYIDETCNTWNGNDNTPVKKDDLYRNEEFVNSSNLMGYLGFTDDDIYNQKNRVKKSFLRLSFYDSPNPLEQSLLYYSTIFLDSGELFGKFVKRKAWLEEQNSNYNEAINPVVWSYGTKNDVAQPVTSQITVNDEYDLTRSGEGFNLYLFKQDAPIENDPQPIYMKVEFNHAGYGRTIPFIFWKRGYDGKPISLNIANYFENLYIKMKYALTDKGYVYFVDGMDDNQPGIRWEDDRLIFNLFEPMLELQGDSIPDTGNVPANVTATFEQQPNEQ